jgi:hypothetical protein
MPALVVIVVATVSVAVIVSMLIVAHRSGKS